MKKQSRQVQGQLRRLFGEPVFCLAQFADVAALGPTAELMDCVHAAADALLAMRSRQAPLSAQQDYIGRLSFLERLVLCMWLLDTGLASKIIRTVYTRA